MIIRAINLSPNKRNFKANLAADVGASDPRASKKILITDKNGEKIYQVPRTFVNDSRDGFVSNDEFIKKDVNVNLKNYKIAMDKMTDDNEKVFRKFIEFLPGPISIDKQGIQRARMNNIKDDGGKGLTDIDLDSYRAQLIKRAKEMDIPVSPDLKCLFVKDAVGSAVGAGLALVNNGYADKLANGKFVTVIMPGGGCTIADLMPIDNDIYVKTTESAYNASVRRINGHIVRLGEIGATAKTVIRNYVNGLGIHDPGKVKTLQDLGKAEIATLNSFKVKIGYGENSTTEEIRSARRAEEAVNILVDTGYYEKILEGEGEDKTAVLYVKDDASSQTHVKNARYRAYDMFAQVMAEAVILKNNEEINTIILTGPLANGINQAIKEDSRFYNDYAQSSPEVFYRDKNGKIIPTDFTNLMSKDADSKPVIKDLKDLVLAKVDRYTGEHTTPNYLAKTNNLEIICDDKLKVADNTVAAKVLLDKNSGQISPDRTNWWKIPRSAFGL